MKLILGLCFFIELLVKQFAHPEDPSEDDGVPNAVLAH